MPEWKTLKLLLGKRGRFPGQTPRCSSSRPSRWWPCTSVSGRRPWSACAAPEIISFSYWVWVVNIVLNLSPYGTCFWDINGLSPFRLRFFIAVVKESEIVTSKSPYCLHHMCKPKLKLSKECTCERLKANWLEREKFPFRPKGRCHLWRELPAEE